MESVRSMTIWARLRKGATAVAVAIALLVPVAATASAVGGGTWESGYDGAGHAFSNFFVGAYHGSSVDGNVGPLVRSACIKEYEWSYAKSKHNQFKSEVSRAYYRYC